MKVLIVTIFNYPHVGGLSTHVDMLSKELSRRDHEVDIISYRNVSHSIEDISYEMCSGLTEESELIKYYIRSINCIRLVVEERLKTKEYDIINAEDVMAMSALKDISASKVLTVHGYLTFENLSTGRVHENSSEERFLLDIEKQGYSAANEVIAVDTELKNYIKSLIGVDVNIIKNFVDTDELDANKYDQMKVRDELGVDRDVRVLFCPRRLTDKNGVIYPAIAVNQLKDILRNLILYYSSDGEDRGLIENFIRTNNLQERIILLGEISHEYMIKYYAASDAVIIPSIDSKSVKEATSISALEAMSMSKPVIASSIGGLKELIVDRKSGLLVEEKNISQLVDAIMRVMLNNRLRMSISKGARRRVLKEFSIIDGVQKYIDVYIKARN